MPYESDAQRRWAHTTEGTEALGGKDKVKEWDEATAGKKLPEKVKKADPERLTFEETKGIAKEIGIDFSEVSFKPEAFHMGLNMEMQEHGSGDPETNVIGQDGEKAGKIAWAHLKEDPQYYSKLRDMEMEKALSQYGFIEDPFQKARPAAPIGSRKTWQGVEYERTDKGWRPVKKRPPKVQGQEPKREENIEVSQEPKLKVAPEQKQEIQDKFKKYEKFVYDVIKKYPIYNTERIGMTREDLQQEARTILLEALLKQSKYKQEREAKGLPVAGESTFLYTALKNGFMNLGKKIHAGKRMPEQEEVPYEEEGSVQKAKEVQFVKDPLIKFDISQTGTHQNPFIGKKWPKGGIRGPAGKIKDIKPAKRQRWPTGQQMGSPDRIKKALVENQNVISVTDTNSESLAKLSVPQKYAYYMWLETRDIKINATKEIQLPKGILLHITKLDDGIYSGYVTKEGVSDTAEIPLRFEKKTLSEIVKALEVKEFIEPQVVIDNEAKAEEKIDKELSPTVTVTAHDGEVTINMDTKKSKEIENKENTMKGNLIADPFNRFEYILKEEDLFKNLLENLPSDEEMSGLVKSLDIESKELIKSYVEETDESIEKAYMGFAKLANKVGPKVAAYVGRKKYGKEKFQSMAAAGKKSFEKAQVDKFRGGVGIKFGNQGAPKAEKFRGGAGISFAKPKIMKPAMPKVRKSLVEDLKEALLEKGYTTETIIAEIDSKGIPTMIEKLDKSRKEEFINRLRGQKQSTDKVEKAIKDLDLPATIKSEEDIKKAKRAFKSLVKSVTAIKGNIESASKTAYAVFKSKYGQDGMDTIKKDIKESQALRVSLGELCRDQFSLINRKLAESGNQGETVKKAFVDDPLRGLKNKESVTEKDYDAITKKTVDIKNEKIEKAKANFEGQCKNMKDLGDFCKGKIDSVKEANEELKKSKK